MSIHPLVKPLALRLGKRVLVGVLEEALKVAEGRMPVPNPVLPPRQPHPERSRVFFQPTVIQHDEKPLHRTVYEGMKSWATEAEAEPGAKPWT